jgi:LytS/YehU family sensor histidine kinase
VQGENWAGGELSVTALNWALRVAVGIGVTHLFRVYAKRHEWADLPLFQLVLRGLAATVVLGACSTALKMVPPLLEVLPRTAHTRANPPFAWGIAGDVVLVGAWLAVYLGVHAAWGYRQAEVDRWRLQARAEAARLEALKTQVNPRFFFSSLESVKALIEEAPERARKMVARLARLLRQTLQSRTDQTVPLARELATTKTYLQLEAVRVDGCFEWEVETPEAVRERPVPFMLVQTLAEHVLRRGSAPPPGGGTVRVEAWAEEELEEAEGATRIRVAGPGPAGGGASADGVPPGRGLQNARERLTLLYGPDATLEVDQQPGEPVEALARLPHPRPEDETVGVAQNGPPGPDSSEESAVSKPPTGALPDRAPCDRQKADGWEAGRFEADGGLESGTTNGASLLGGSCAYWLCQVAGWGALLAVVLLATGGDADESWTDFIEQAALAVAMLPGIGIGLTHALRAYATWAGWAGLPPLRLAPRLIGAAALLGTSHVVATAPYALPADLPEAPRAWLVAALKEAGPPAVAFTLIMGAWLAIYFGVKAVQKHRQAEVDRWLVQTRMEAARLEALETQLNPHFFFNSLTSVRSLIAEAPNEARTMVSRLSRLLRRILQAGDEPTVPLRDALSTARTYLQIEKVRFADRLDWAIEASEAARGRAVPFMLVQTLAENAVKHGIAQRQDGGTVRIEAEVATGAADGAPLRLRVSNPGRLGDGAQQGSGTGVANARKRLRLLFGENAALELRQSGPQEVTAAASIPRGAAPGRRPEDTPAPDPEAAQKLVKGGVPA